jgi:dCTP deaminase
LCTTSETIGSNRYAMTMSGTSSVGRLGVYVNVTADLGHVGSIGKWTLELTVIQPVRLYPGMLIGQVAFWMTNPARLYDGRYKFDTTPVPSRDADLLVRHEATT